MIKAWRIDSLDVRGGLAFASWRISDLDVGNIDLDRPAVFVSPPLFQPEAVTNRAIGLSAARAQAQLGVYVEGEELAFETIEELTEFVRRAYVGSGGGDPGEGGGGGPPAPPENRPDVPHGGRPSVKGENERGPILKAASLALELAAEMALAFEPGHSTQSEPLKATGSYQRSVTQSGAILVDGATEILLELLRRFPIKGKTEELQKWTRSAHSFGAALNRTGLWPIIMSGPYSVDFENILEKIIGAVPSQPRLDRAQGYLLPILFGATALGGPLTIYDIDLIKYFARHGLPFYWGAVRLTEGDPVDHLTYWPLPNEFTRVFNTADKNPSAFHLLSSTSANPGQLAAGSDLKLAARAVSVLVFCAAYLLSESQPTGQSSWLIPEAQEAERELMLSAATDWLLRQWPSLIFPKQVEQIIGQAATLSA